MSDSITEVAHLIQALTAKSKLLREIKDLEGKMPSMYAYRDDNDLVPPDPAEHRRLDQISDNLNDQINALRARGTVLDSEINQAVARMAYWTTEEVLLQAAVNRLYASGAYPRQVDQKK